MKIKPRLLLLCLCIAAFTGFSGCLRSTEISDLPLTLGLGVDKSDDPAGFKIIAQIAKPSQLKNPASGGGGGSSEPAYANFESGGETIFDAIRNLTKMIGDRIFASHSEVLLFGNGIAREGMRDYIDFFLRNPDVRPSAYIIVTQSTVKEIMDLKPLLENVPVTSLKRILKTQEFTSETAKVTLIEFTSCLMSKTKSAVAPVAGVAENGGKKAAFISGLAVFKNYKLAGTFNRKETRGLLWVLDKIKKGILNVPKKEDGKKIAIEIISSKCKAIPEIKGTKLRVHIKIREQGSLSEQPVGDDFISLDGLEYLKQAQADAIKDEIMSAFNKSVELKTDPFGFGELLHKKYPKEWKNMEQYWDSLYPTIELVFDIKTSLVKTDAITKSVSPE
ncbi:MAG: Ger(x)C family spore germination protein [Bacillota bacterium]|nr:Ger(x)C family spore germination protein [Bacillota bacterium]